MILLENVAYLVGDERRVELELGAEARVGVVLENRRLPVHRQRHRYLMQPRPPQFPAPRRNRSLFSARISSSRSRSMCRYVSDTPGLRPERS